jgi:hypothetical protein
METKTQSLNDQIATMQCYLDSIKADSTQLQAGTKASSAKVRKSLLNLKKECHSMRGNCTTVMKAIPTKPRTKKVVPVEPEPETESEEEIVPVQVKPAKKKRVKAV